MLGCRDECEAMVGKLIPTGTSLFTEDTENFHLQVDSTTFEQVAPFGFSLNTKKTRVVAVLNKLVSSLNALTMAKMKELCCLQKLTDLNKEGQQAHVCDVSIRWYWLPIVG